MLEYANPIAVSVPETANLTDPVFDNARVHPDAAAFSVQTDGRWRTVTAREFAEQVVSVAKGLIAMGVDAGDRVGGGGHQALVRREALCCIPGAVGMNSKEGSWV